VGRPVLTAPQAAGEGSRFGGEEGGSACKIFPVLGLQRHNQQFARIQAQTPCFHFTSPAPVHHRCRSQKKEKYKKPLGSYSFCGLPFAGFLAVTPRPGIPRWSPVQAAPARPAPAIGRAQPGARRWLLPSPRNPPEPMARAGTALQNRNAPSGNSLPPSHTRGGRCGLATHQERPRASFSSNPKRRAMRDNPAIRSSAPSPRAHKWLHTRMARGGTEQHLSLTPLSLH